MSAIELSGYVESVRRVALKVRRRLPEVVELDDLIADGFIGLTHAARTFDPARGVPFPRFAVRRIEGAMLDGLRQRDWVSRGVRAIDNPSLRSLPLDLVDPGEFDQRILDLQSIAGALSRLERRSRLILELYYLEGMDLQQIGGALGVTVPRISQLRKKAMRALRGGSPDRPAGRPTTAGRSRPAKPSAARMTVARAARQIA